MTDKNEKTAAETAAETAQDLKDRIPHDVRESAQKIWLAGLGALSAAEQEGSKIFKNLVEKGEKLENRSKDFLGDTKEDVDGAVKDAKSKAEQGWKAVEDRMDEAVSSAFKRFGVPSREEIATLTQRVEELTRMVESLKTPAAAPKKTTARSSKTTAGN